MKKALCVILALFTLAGCSSATDESSVSEETITTDTSDISDINFTREDFVLRGIDDEGNTVPVIWLGMTKDIVDENSRTHASYFEGINDIGYNHQPVTDDEGNITEETVEYVSLISYLGSREYLETEKGIRTSGLYGTASKPNSTAREVIDAYGLDPENESIYIGSPEEDNYTIALYFNIDNHNNVTRIISPVDTDLSDIEALHGDYFIRFMITQDEVSGIQLYRRRPVDA